MKKEIHPGVAVAAVVIIVLIAGYFFYRHTATPPPQAMNPLGPGAAALKANGGNMTNNMTPQEKAMLGGRNGANATGGH